MVVLRATRLATVLGVLGILQAAETSPEQVLAPLRVYAGNWKVTRDKMASGAKPEDLQTECAAIGQYFACQQKVNGAVGGLLIIVPSREAGRYYTQNVVPSGRATGTGELRIPSPGKWIFLSSWNQGGGKSIRYRTTYTFSGRDRIRFEQEQSDDGQHWKVIGSGEQVRAGR